MDGSSLFRHTITVQRKATTKDTSGAQVENYTAVTALTAIPCLVQERHGKAVRMIGGRQVIVSHAVYLESGLDIRRGDRLFWEQEGIHLIHHGVSDMGGQGRISRIEASETLE